MFFLKQIKIILFFIGIFFAIPAFAQTQSFSIVQNPQNPDPGEIVFFSLSAYEFNIDLANISWSVDGKVKDSGVGKKFFSVLAPIAGKVSSIEVSVTPPGGQLIKNSVFLNTSNMDIIWEAIDSYTPPFYKGKSLPISQSQVKVVAIPIVKKTNGAIMKPEEFIFNWKKDGKNFPGQSGLAKNIFSFANEILEKQNRVDVTATDGTKTISSSTILSFFEPEIIFYNLDTVTLAPKYSEAVGKARNLKQSRIGIVAEPYFLSSDFKNNPNIKTVWRVNDQDVNPSSKNSILVNATSTVGNVAVSFDYNDTKRLFRNFNYVSNLSITK